MTEHTLTFCSRELKRTIQEIVIRHTSAGMEVKKAVCPCGKEKYIAW